MLVVDIWTKRKEREAAIAGMHKPSGELALQLFDLADLLQHQIGDLTTASALLHQAYEVSRSLEDQELIEAAAARLVYVNFRRGDPSAVERWVTEARRASPQTEAWLWSIRLAELHWWIGAVDKAQGLLEEVLNHVNHSDNPCAVALATLHLGGIAVDLGRLTAGHGHLVRALEATRLEEPIVAAERALVENLGAVAAGLATAIPDTPRALVLAGFVNGSISSFSLPRPDVAARWRRWNIGVASGIDGGTFEAHFRLGAALRRDEVLAYIDDALAAWRPKL